MSYKDIFTRVRSDSRYQENLDWGKPRRGHPEGTMRAHIAELEGNLALLPVNRESETYWKLMVLIHVHDTFKKDSRSGVPISDPNSHASLARRFLSEYCRDADLLQMVQLHDEPFALYRQQCFKGAVNPARLRDLLESIEDWELFLKFLLVDGFTAGKSPEPLEWSLRNLASVRGLDGSMRQWLEALQRGSLSAHF